MATHGSYSLISSLASKNLWSALQFTGKDWIDGSVESSYILAALLQQQWRVSLYSDRISRSALCEVLGCKRAKQLLQKSYFFVWMSIAREGHIECMGPQWTAFMLHIQVCPLYGRYITSPQVPLPTALGGLLGVCPTPLCRLLGAGLTADRLPCRVSSCGKHSCNHSSERQSPIFFLRKNAFHSSVFLYW